MRFFILFISFNCIGATLFIEGEMIEYKDGLISASTKTTIIFENMKIKSDAITINKDTILATSAHLQTENLQFFGKRIKKEKERIKIEDGWFSTCSNKNPHFRLTSKHITIGPRFVKASNIKLYLGNFPIFYMPFYSQPLEMKGSPYSMEFGSSDYLGFYVKTRYNYFSKKNVGFLLDYYQKENFGYGFLFNNEVFGYYNKKDKWLLDVSYKNGPVNVAIEKLSNRAFIHNYLKGDIKDETNSYIMLENIGSSNASRLVFEEEDNFSKRVYYLPKANIFFLAKFFGFVTSLDISGENVYKEGGNFTINPKVSKRFQKILQTVDIKAKNDETNICSISHIRLINNKNHKLDLGYSILYPKKEKKLLFLSDFLSGMGSIEGEFLIPSKTFDNVMFLFPTPHLTIDGRYKDDKTDVCISTGFKRERYELELLWLIKEQHTIIPSILLKRDDASFKIKGHYGRENYLELSLSKLYHCINVDFMINTKKDIGMNLSIR